MKNYVSAIFLFSSLTGCAPYAPHMWIRDEFIAIQKLCTPGEEGVSKSTSFSSTRRWSCNNLGEYATWEKLFLADLTKRGWYAIESPHPWKTMCNDASKGVLLSYYRQTISSDQIWTFGVTLRFPSNECGKSEEK